MPLAFPNIFPLEPRRVAVGFYALAIPKLLRCGQPAEAVRMLRKVRSYARHSGVSARLVEWTWSFELDALLELGQTEDAWLMVRRSLRARWPRLAARPVEQRVQFMEHFVQFAEAPAAYFSGRNEYAARALEAWLDEVLLRIDAYDLRYTLFNDDDPPASAPRVTLWHIYRRLNRRLDSWSGWKVWVQRLHPRLLKLSRLTANELAADPALLAVFESRLEEIERGRRPAGITYGQRDVLEPKAKVLARQKAHLAWKPSEQQAAATEVLRQKRIGYFPWLAALPP